MHSHIGYGTPVEDTPKAHGEPLGPDGVRAAKRFYGWPEDAEFLVPDGVREHFADGIGRAARRLARPGRRCSRSTARRTRSSRTRSSACSAATLPEAWEAAIPEFPADAKGLASRDSSGQVLNAVAQSVPWLVGGAADLAPVDEDAAHVRRSRRLQPGDRSGRNFHFGVREFASAAIANGLALSKLRPFWSGFLIFSDYARGAIRLSALMEIPVIHIFTHDSIGVGEDGPTHRVRLKDTLYFHGEQLVLDGLPLHVADDVEVFAQVTATEIHDLKFLVFKPVGALRLGDQLMRVEVSLDGFVLRVRVLFAEGEEHRIHEELLGLYLYTHPHLFRSSPHHPAPVM